MNTWSHHPTRKSSVVFEDHIVLLKVDLFLTDLERRLAFLEDYKPLKLDASLAAAHETLQSVRIACSEVSGEIMGEGRRRARVLVETVEKSYNDALATKDTLEQKIITGIHILEGTLQDFESRIYAIRGEGLSNIATHLLDSGRRKVDTGLSQARLMMDEATDLASRAKVNLKDSINHAIARAKEQQLIAYSDLPDPWRINPHILHGYRFTETTGSTIRSAFIQLSNESFNIYSHALGVVLILAIAFYSYPLSPHFSDSNKTDIAVAALFFFAACKCLVCSCMWHTMSSISSQSVMERFACVDYSGIGLLVSASIVSTEYTAFYCEPVSRWTYISLTILFGIGGVILPWRPAFNRKDMAWARVSFYITLAGTGFLPVAQLLYTRGVWWVWYFYSPLIKSLTVYVVGACLYASKVPERFWPGGFDYIGGSHNIWHAAVLMGIIFHYSAMLSFFNDAFQRKGPSCSIY